MNNRLAMVVVAWALSGCTTMSLEELRQTEPTGSPFHKALTKLYMDFAIDEARDYDWMDSMLFADKGLLAAYGKDVAPEDLARWDIPEVALADLMQSRESLMAILTPNVMEAKPQLAAEAQFYFDCWVEQQEENWQEADIAYCQESFRDALDQLAGKEPRLSKTAEKPEASTMMPGEKPEASKPSSDFYVVFFRARQSIMTDDSKDIVDEAARSLAQEINYEVVVNGHTDTAGDAKENLELSQKRADAVRARLVAEGVKADAIKIFAYGESDLKVKTGDGVSEPKNRRVEIFLQ